jgi:hypothetical protein
MKRVTIGIAIIFLTVTIYFIVSCGLLLYKKQSLDQQISDLQDAQGFGKKESGITKLSRDRVVIQNAIDDNDADSKEDTGNPRLFQFGISSKPERPLAIIRDEVEDDFFVESDGNEQNTPLDSYSFVTMPIGDDYIIDRETQDSLNILIGNDLDDFVKLVLQSNNNIVTKEACRSCGMYAFFSDIKKRQKLTKNEVIILQKSLANLYQFVEKMKLLSKKIIISPEQYAILENLNRPQSIINDMKLQVRRAATSAALKKLQAIQYNR